jgi:hypothetical protein
MSENTDKQLKDKIKALEGDMKTAFKDNRFDAVRSLAKELTAIDAGNPVAVKLMEKIAEAEAVAKARQNTAKIKEYEDMLAKQYKDANFENVKKLVQELKALDATNKNADNWLKKTESAIAEQSRKQNETKISAYENEMKKAFKEAKFDLVKEIAPKLTALDPQNKLAVKLVGDIEKAKYEALKKANADKINILQNKAKQAFASGKFAELDQYSREVLTIDPENGYIKKLLAKAEDIKKEAGLKVAKEMAKAKQIAEKPVKKEELKVQKPVGAVPAKTEEKSKTGLFAKLFKKPEVTEVKPALQIVKPQVASAPKSAPQPVLQVSKPVAEGENKMGVFAKLFKKQEEAEIKPVSQPVKPQIATIAKAVAQPVLQVSKPAVEDKGNIFTKMFGDKDESSAGEKAGKSIIDTIVAKTAAKKAESRMAKVEKKVEKKEEGAAFVTFSKMFLQFTVAFIVITAGFFYVQNIDANNRVLGLMGMENYASRLHNAAQDLEKKKTDEAGINKEIDKFKKGYDNQYEKTINGIIQKRLNWPDVLAKINEVANSISPENEILQYIKFNSFSFDAEKRSITVSGTLTDSLGKNLTKLAMLEEAFKYYPKDKTNPDDTTKPYFENLKEFTSFSKSFNKTTGKYTSNFQLSFTLAEQPQKTEKETAKETASETAKEVIEAETK